MAEAVTKQWEQIDYNSLTELKTVVWGNRVSEEVFLRWTQGLSFSEAEPSALIQVGGGPCAVIAPLQAFILKNILFRTGDVPAPSNSSENEVVTVELNQVAGAEVQKHLCNAVLDIIRNVSLEQHCTLVTHPGSKQLSTEEASTSAESDGETDNKRPKLFSFDSFHEQLECKSCSFEDIKDWIDWYTNHLLGDFGVLSLLYSVIITAGLDKIKSIVEDTGEPLIDPTYGHGGQCLINLILTGEPTAQVFDGEQDAGGLKLSGISKQSQIGFLSLIEAHRLLEVGWNLKSPVYPIWVLASESHLTVIFSKDKDIVAEDKQTEVVRIINTYDTEGNAFINTALLTDLMAALNLLTEPEEYVNIIREKLDPEGLGIFLITSFMQEFFPKDNDNDERKNCFELSHYNGIKRSNDSNKIQYHKSKATLRDFLEPTVVVDDSQILKCLQTKWPTIELEWRDNVVPSIN